MPSTQTATRNQTPEQVHPNPVMEKYYAGRNKADRQFADLAVLKKRAFNIRMKTLEHLDKHLLDFESQFNKHQGKVIWAPSADFALNEIGRLTKDKKALYRHSGIAEEIQLASAPNFHCLNPVQEGFDAHPVFPAWNKKQEKKNSEINLIQQNDAAILFPEFLVSETGSVALAFDHPQVGQMAALCDTLIFVAGIEQLLPLTNDLELMLSLLSTYKYGRKDQPYYLLENGHLAGNRQKQGREIFVVILDNGRTDLLGQIPQRQSLYCINCGACLNAGNNITSAREFKDFRYPGVIGSIKAPYLDDFEKQIERSFQHPLSGKATADCPVNIDLKDLLLENRHQAVIRKSSSRMDGYAWMVWKKAMLSRKWMNQGAGMKNFTLKGFFKKNWGEQREFPKVADKSFNQWWAENRKPEDDRII